jgi:predicted dehydrogenase
MKVGVIGCGAISDAYFKTNATFHFYEIVSCADLNLDRAKEKKEKWNLQRAYSAEDMLKDDEVQCIINLTIPIAHGPIMEAAVRAGKHVYNEKPFTVTREEAKKTIELAKSKNLRVGSAPDTFLGGGHQTVRKLIDDGAIGRPVAATAFMACHGHESWHPSPAFYYQKGGGPMFDMGPYYLTDLVQLIGPVKKVAGMTAKTFPTRTITSKALNGTVVNVEVPTHITGAMEFANGAIGTAIMTFDVWAHSLPRLEIHGTEGSIFVPDPNGFGGEIILRKPGKEPEKIPFTHGYTDNSRGIGMADMIRGIQAKRDHRCNERLAYHVLDIMHAFHDSSNTGKHVDLASTCERPAMLPVGLQPGELD